MKKVCPKVIYLKPYSLSPSLGFTLIELLVVLTISILLLGVGVAAYNSFNQNQILNQAVSTLRTDLRDAQNRALSGEKPAGCSVLNGYRVTFPSATRYQVQAWCGIGVGVGSMKTINLTGVQFTPTPGPILFKSLTHGATAATITLQNTSTSATSTVVVSASGDVR